MVEQAAVNRKVEGSSPSLGAIFFESPRGREPERAEISGEDFCAEPCVSTGVADSACGASESPSRIRSAESMQIRDSACGASVSPSLGAIFFRKAQEGEKSRIVCAGMAELADAQDLKSCDPYRSYRFDPGFRHQSCFGRDIAEDNRA